MSYFRTRYRSFEEFQRETFYPREELGKDELELIEAMEDEDLFDRMTQTQRRRRRAAYYR